MTNTQPLYALVGDGRLARHLGCYFDFLKIPYLSWSRRKPQPGIEKADVVLLAIRDDALAEFPNTFEREQGFDLRAKGRPLVNFSGALTVPGQLGFHPLMTFGAELYSEAEYRAIPFLGESGATGFRDIFPALPNPHFALPQEQKARYHAHCVMSGNFTTLLWRRFFAFLETELGVPGMAGLPYLRRIAANLASDPAAALTGPLARGDVATLRRDLEGLKDDVDARRIFESFIHAERPDMATQLELHPSKGTSPWTS